MHIGSPLYETPINEKVADMRRACGGAYVSVASVCAYTGWSRDIIDELVKSVTPYGKGTGKRYYVGDIIKAIEGRKNICRA